jgi:hypothetical protein
MYGWIMKALTMTRSPSMRPSTKPWVARHSMVTSRCFVMTCCPVLRRTQRVWLLMAALQHTKF